MFEKDAEEYVNEHSEYDETFDMVFVNCETKKAFKDGAEFGYNKANEWHYVKDGDLPKENQECYFIYSNTLRKMAKGLITIFAENVAGFMTVSLKWSNKNADLFKR